MCPCDVLSEREGVDETREHEVSDTNWNLYVVNIESYIRVIWGDEGRGESGKGERGKGRGGRGKRRGRLGWWGRQSGGLERRTEGERYM